MPAAEVASYKFDYRDCFHAKLFEPGWYINDLLGHFDDEQRDTLDATGAFEIAFDLATQMVDADAAPVEIDFAVHSILREALR